MYNSARYILYALLGIRKTLYVTVLDRWQFVTTVRCCKHMLPSYARQKREGESWVEWHLVRMQAFITAVLPIVGLLMRSDCVALIEPKFSIFWFRCGRLL